MNDIEALKLLLEGKRLCRSGWFEGRYIQLANVYHDGNCIWDSSIKLNSCLADYFYGRGEWSEYTTPKNLIEEEKLVAWVNVYRNDDGNLQIGGMTWPTEIGRPVIATIKIKEREVVFNFPSPHEGT